MAKEIISFRITPEAAACLDKLKETLKQTSTEILNSLITSNRNENTNSKQIQVFRTIPEDSLDDYLSSKLDPMTKAKMSSVPFCSMSIKRHAEAKCILEKEGFHYFYFPVEKELYMSIIAVNKEEASMQFQKFYTYDKEAKSYVRTSCPLPQYRYDIKHKNIIIFEYE